MSTFPHSLYRDQALYTAIPLALDMNHIHSYFSYLENPFGDCQLFSTQELPTNSFSYCGVPYSILLDKSKGIAKHESNKKKQRNNLEKVPFTTLLVGHSYACNTVLKDYDTWAMIDDDSLVSPRISKKKNVSSEHGACWLPVQHPYVWAQATFSDVNVTTAYPQALEKELYKIFDFPISVNPIIPSSINRHNEFAAWLASIYALVTARNLYRTVLCHSHMWMHQIQFFYDAYKKMEYLPKAWEKMAYTPSITHHEHESPKDASVNRAKKLSHYDIKKQTYKQKDSLMARMIGMGVARKPILEKQICASIIEEQDFQLSVEYDNKHVKIISPILPNERTHITMRELVSQQLNIPLEQVSIEVHNKKECYDVKIDSYYSIVTNLVIHGIKDITPRIRTARKRIKLSQCKFITKQHVSSSVVVECDINRHTKELVLSKVIIVIDGGYVSNEKREFGYVEDIFFSSFFSLCGNHKNVSNDFNLEIEFLQKKAFSYTTDFCSIVKPAVEQAIINTIGTHSSHQEIPTKRII